MHRIVAFAQQSQLHLELAYYPPYHSKYNPVERTFGWLEQHWNGSLQGQCRNGATLCRNPDLQRETTGRQAG